MHCEYRGLVRFCFRAGFREMRIHIHIINVNKRKLNILPILAAMNQSAKEARERFVSGHTGASIFEVEYLVHSGVLFHFLNVITFPLVNVLMRNKLSIWLAAALCNTNEFA